MNNSINRISLDIHEHGSQAVLKAKKTDTGRMLHITLREGGTPYIIEADCYAVFKATKPDGSILYNACTIERNEIIYEFTEQTCTAVGRCSCEIALYGLDDKLITSPRFALLVDGTIYPEGSVESTDEFSALSKLISGTLEATEAATQAAQSAGDSSNIALDSANRANVATAAANLASENASSAAVLAGQATTSANQAAAAATKSAQDANTVAGDARHAAEDADSAAASANQAAQSANSASINANQAATKAAQTAKSLMVIGKATGTAIHLDDAIDQFLVGCRIFGKTTQDGTPTPDAPAELVSVGSSGSITVNVTGDNEAQNMTIATPNGLPGIPVTSGGNYTDASGQQWVCDEIDFASGVYVKRIGRYTFTGNETSSIYGSVNANGYGRIQILCEGSPSAFKDIATGVPSFCSKYISDSAINIGSLINGGGTVYKFGYLNDRQMVFSTQCKTVESFKAEISGTTILYQLATPIEAPLSEEDLAAYAALHTYRGNTTVSNDAGAYMELEYVMDAKKYIDSLVAGKLHPATVE